MAPAMNLCIFSFRYRFQLTVIGCSNIMDLKQLRYFVTVAEALSFVGAANRLHMSQPPLLAQLRNSR